MSGLRLDITGTAGVRAMRFGFYDFSQQVADLKPFLENVLRVFEAYADKQFDTEGAFAGNRWAPLSKVTEEIRSQTGFSGLPILQNTGRLRAALGSARGSGALRIVTSNGFIYGTNGVHYASFHQNGTRQTVTEKQAAFMRLTYGIHLKVGTVLVMPARPPLDFDDKGKGKLRKALIEAAREHLVTTIRRGGLPPRWTTVVAGAQFNGP